MTADADTRNRKTLPDFDSVSSHEHSTSPIVQNGNSELHVIQVTTEYSLCKQAVGFANSYESLYIFRLSLKFSRMTGSQQQQQPAKSSFGVETLNLILFRVAKVVNSPPHMYTKVSRPSMRRPHTL